MGEAIERLTGHGDRIFEYDYGPGLLPEPGGRFDLWRYQRLLPRPDESPRFPLRVGGTPLRPAPRLGATIGVPRLWLKDETANPSASNKDRATALVVDAALRAGETVVTTSSTGNAAVSTARGAASAGLAAVIFVPEDCAAVKVATMTAAGARVFRVRQGYRAAFELSRAAAARFGWADRNTGANPATIEAKKTVALEIWEQLGRRVPQVVAVPVGDGPTLVGMAKGFRELRACGVIDDVPRIIGVQAAACAPLADRWRNMSTSTARATAVDPAPDPAATIADGIAVPVPSVGEWTLDEVRLASGSFVTVADREIEAAIAALEELAGVRSEPAGAAAVAGLRCAVEQGLADPGETAVALVTGAGVARPHPGGAGCAVGGDGGDGGGRGWVRTIDADLDEVAAALTRLAVCRDL